ncbi:MAG: hypothetical protein JWR21_3416 [Herminiimonas sp.]|nr:hypothetical protein [Herminiimonas sp.]MDB5854477.1 hypothetical protein [Herminiimonas sp.]
MPRRVSIPLGILLALLLFCRDAGADPVSNTDARAIQDVVQSQLDALSEDDAGRAFSLATEHMRSLIGTPERFLQMIKDQYPPVYRNRLALFSPPERIDGHTVIIVRLTDKDNLVWLAVYEMTRDADGIWKIEGCNLVETATVSI